MRRHTIGIIAIVLLFGALATLLLDGYGIRLNSLKATCWRIGPMLGVLWLAWPEIRRIPKRFYWSVLAVLVVVAWRPQVLWFLIPLVGLAAVLRPRATKKR